MLSVGAVSLPHPVCDARSYGAKGDSATLDTGAIQRAIDACARRRRAGHIGGRHVPEWDAGAQGPCHIGRRARGDPARVAAHRRLPPVSARRYRQDRRRWVDSDKGNRPFHLIHAENAVDVAIEGGGTIVGNGAAFWDSGTDGAPVSRRARPSPLIEFVATRGIRVEDLTIRDAPGWTIHPLEFVGYQRSDASRSATTRRGPIPTQSISIYPEQGRRSRPMSWSATLTSSPEMIASCSRPAGRRPGRPVPPTENVRVTRIRCSSRRSRHQDRHREPRPFSQHRDQRRADLSRAGHVPPADRGHFDVDGRRRGLR